MVRDFCGRFLRKVFAEGFAEGSRKASSSFGFFVFAEGSAEGFAEGFLLKISRPAAPHGKFPEGFRKDSGRFRAKGDKTTDPPKVLRKVLRKVLAEGSRGRFCGRFFRVR